MHLELLTHNLHLGTSRATRAAGHVHTFPEWRHAVAPLLQRQDCLAPLHQAPHANTAAVNSCS